MVKILLTGDIHLGRNYRKEAPDIAEKYTAARIKALEKAVEIANREQCHFFVIAGDLYDRTAGIPVSLHKEVCRILENFAGDSVLILPGNHDYYDAENDQLWKKFEEYSCSHIKVFQENKKYRAGDVIFYPCICYDKHSKANALGWLSEERERHPSFYHIGIAHGAIEGLSYDKNQEYYFMTQKELFSYGMDIWLIGHTHVAYPAVVDNALEQRIFNAGTPQQTDIADSSAGEVFVLTIEDDRRISAKKEAVGSLYFVRKAVSLQYGQSLESALEFPELVPERTSLRLSISGVTSTKDYEDRSRIYGKLQKEYLKAEIDDSMLRKEITPEMIDRETMKDSVINRLLHSYQEDTELLNLAYDMALSCKNKERAGR